jgi:hypothetical protein
VAVYTGSRVAESTPPQNATSEPCHPRDEVRATLVSKLGGGNSALEGSVL